MKGRSLARDVCKGDVGTGKKIGWEEEKERKRDRKRERERERVREREREREREYDRCIVHYAGD